MLSENIKKTNNPFAFTQYCFVYLDEWLLLKRKRADSTNLKDLKDVNGESTDLQEISKLTV